MDVMFLTNKNQVSTMKGQVKKNFKERFFYPINFTYDLAILNQRHPPSFVL